MTIQICGSYFNGSETVTIEKYFGSMEDAQNEWDYITNRCKNCIGVDIRAIKNPDDNVRASHKHTWISGSLIGTYIK